jgi:2-keto-4-pentenoate hydratase/2-oxohepta-3-ene-1,7-dioic acid hydratase in catechol pathway
MKIARYDQGAIGAIVGDGVRDLTDLIDPRWQGTPFAINDLIARWDELGEQAAELVAQGPERDLAEVALLAPTPRPQHLFAAPLNYKPHVAEMVDSKHAPVALRPEHSAAGLGFFLKPSGSISGPADPILLPPMAGRSFHHEIELGVVIGSGARGLSVAEARAHIFGYVCLLDITLRTEGELQEERVMRKSYESFTPIGPVIVTADEIDDPDALDLHLEVNGESRQRANTADLIVGVDELIARASNVLPLAPGDVYATGTPEGVGPIEVGDTVTAGVERVGEMELRVERRDW